MRAFIKVLLLMAGRFFVVAMIAHLLIFFEAGLTYLLLGDPSARLFVLAVPHTCPYVDVKLVREQYVGVFDTAFLDLR